MSSLREYVRSKIPICFIFHSALVVIGGEKLDGVGRNSLSKGSGFILIGAPDELGA